MEPGTSEYKTYSVEAWAALLRAGGVTKEKLTGDNEFTVAHISGPTIVHDGERPLLIVPVGWETWSEEEWLEIEFGLDDA